MMRDTAKCSSRTVHSGRLKGPDFWTVDPVATFT